MNRIRIFIGVAIIIFALVATYALSSAQVTISPITFSLEEMNDSGESGTVTLTDLGGGKTQVEITVEGAPAGASQPVQVHEGQCGPTLARLAYPLNNLENGKSTTTINAPLGSLTTEGHAFAINSHKSAKEYTLYLLCGNIPSLAQVAARATATQAAVFALQTRPPGGIPPVSFRLVEENKSGESGTVTLTDLGNGKTMVEVLITGEPDGASQPLHVHEGQCGPTLARLAYPLNNLENGKSTTTINAPLSSLTTEGLAFAINSHKSAKEYTIYVLCGNIPPQVPGAVQATEAAVPATTVLATSTTVPATAVPETATAAPATETTVPATATNVSETATAAPATATSVPATAAPATATAAPETPTSVPATATSVPATAVPATATTLPPTAIPATATAVPATVTTLPATATTVPATATTLPATTTTVPATATTVPEIATNVPATATTLPTTATTIVATATTVPEIATNVPATATTLPATATTVPATATTIVATATAVPEIATTVPATATTLPATATTVPATATTLPTTATTIEATTVPPTPGTAATATPTKPIPETGGNPNSERFLIIAVIGALMLGAGIYCLRVSAHGSKRL